MTITLTGRVQYRIQQRCFGKPLVIVQVEERVRGNHWTRYRGDDNGPDFDYTRWRDARAEDLAIAMAPTTTKE